MLTTNSPEKRDGRPGGLFFSLRSEALRLTGGLFLMASLLPAPADSQAAPATFGLLLFPGATEQPFPETLQMDDDLARRETSGTTVRQRCFRATTDFGEVVNFYDTALQADLESGAVVKRDDREALRRFPAIIGFDGAKVVSRPPPKRIRYVRRHRKPGSWREVVITQSAAVATNRKPPEVLILIFPVASATSVPTAP